MNSQGPKTGVQHNSKEVSALADQLDAKAHAYAWHAGSVVAVEPHGHIEFLLEPVVKLEAKLLQKPGY